MSSLASVGSLKITPPKWDSDRDAEKFVKWFREMGAVVRSLPHGPALQAFLEKKLGIYQAAAQVTPDWCREDSELVQFLDQTPVSEGSGSGVSSGGPALSPEAQWVKVKDEAVKAQSAATKRVSFVTAAHTAATTLAEIEIDVGLRPPPAECRLWPDWIRCS